LTTQVGGLGNRWGHDPALDPTLSNLYIQSG